MKNIIESLPEVISIAIDLRDVHGGVDVDTLIEVEGKDYFFELSLSISGRISEVEKGSLEHPPCGGELENIEIDFNAILVFDSDDESICLIPQDLYSLQMEINNRIQIEVK